MMLSGDYPFNMKEVEKEADYFVEVTVEQESPVREAIEEPEEV